MKVIRVLPWLACAVPGALSIFADDAYQSDYHYQLLGIPQADNTFFQQPFPGSKASLIYTITDKGIIGAVNPKDGNIVWRQQLAHGSCAHHCGNTSFLRAGEGQSTLFTATKGHITSWIASDGRLVWARDFGVSVCITDLRILELESDISRAKDVIALFRAEEDTATVRRIQGSTGKTVWKYDDTSGDIPFRISSSSTALFYVSIHKSLLGGVKMRVTTLNLLTGHKTDQYTLNLDGDLNSHESIHFVGASTAAPILAWADNASKTLKVNVLGSKQISTFEIPATANALTGLKFHAPTKPNVMTHFLVHYQTGNENWAEVFHIDVKNSAIKRAYAVPKLSGTGAFAISTTDANVFFTRVTDEEVTVTSSLSHGILGRWKLKKGNDLPKPLAEVTPMHTISEAVTRSGSGSAVRSAVLMSDGSWILIRNGEVVWSRPEGLSEVIEAVFANWPASEAITTELSSESAQSPVAAYAHRIMRHAQRLQSVRLNTLALPFRGVDHTSQRNVDLEYRSRQDDTFGFRKIVLLATERGWLFALDSGRQGKILWKVDAAKLTSGETWGSPRVRTVSGGTVLVDDNTNVTKAYSLSTGCRVAAVSPSSEAANSTRHGEVKVVEFGVADSALQGRNVFSKQLLWRFALPPDETVLQVAVRSEQELVASIGKVLGDRRVLYKYLNPNLALVTAVSKTRKSLSVYVVDTTSGTLLYATAQAAVDLSRPITSVIAENWFAYSFTRLSKSRETPTSIGPVIAISELYESASPDDRGRLGSAYNYSSITPVHGLVVPHVVSQMYHVPQEILSMTPTQTRQGITNRDLVLTMSETHSIVLLPRILLNPRRPVNRDPSAQEAEEGLLRYSPHLEVDPRWVLNHNREVFDVHTVLVTAASLESTSLIFGYGLDLFGTRVAPSGTFDALGKGFGKLSMLTTVAALAAGVLGVAPWVIRKQVNTLWQ